MAVNAITHENVEKLYEDVARNMKDARELVEQNATFTPEQEKQYNAYMANVDDIRKQAERMEDLMQKDADLVAHDSKAKLDAEKAEQEQKAKEAGFEHAWEFAKAVVDFVGLGVKDQRLEKLMVTKDMSSEVGTSGAFLTPTIQNNEIIQTRGENSILRQRARVVQMGSPTVDFPAVDYGQGAAGKSAFFGGIDVDYVGEGAEPEGSDPKFTTVEMKAKEIAGHVDVPNTLLRDSPQSMEALLSGNGGFGGAMAWKEEWGALREKGGKQMLGIMESPAKILVSRATPADFTFVDAVTMASRMIMSGQPMWMMAQSVMTKLYQMKDAADRYIWQPSAVTGKPDTLLGYPIKWTEKLPLLGVTGDVVLVDWSWYLLGDRGRITFDLSRESLFKKRMTTFMAVEAIDGQPWLQAPITLADGATTVSPFVILN